LSRAGFEAIQVKAEEADFVYADEEEWWSSLWSHGLRGAMESMEPATRERLKADAFQEIQVFKQPDGIHAGIGVLFAFGTKTSNKGNYTKSIRGKHWNEPPASISHQIQRIAKPLLQ
jgi:hypothetical protein